jgi:Uma2 family endonuclease
MAMPAQQTEWTLELVRTLLDDGSRYEVIDGELFVTPAPSWIHQNAVLELALLLVPYLREHAIGHAMIAPADVVFGPRNTTEPDLFVVPLVNGVAPESWFAVGRLLLVVEVISPSTRETDRTDKRKLYARKNVPEYWIVDTDARTIERFRPNEAESVPFAEAIQWHPDPTVPALTIDLPAYFDRVYGRPT